MSLGTSTSLSSIPSLIWYVLWLKTFVSASNRSNGFTSSKLMNGKEELKNNSTRSESRNLANLERKLGIFFNCDSLGKYSQISISSSSSLWPSPSGLRSDASGSNVIATRFLYFIIIGLESTDWLMI
ncbi:hypothetical protein WICPIJ_000990 [Wickerhamomyces pijperi]|uniref:Uncharacterized protein n=1 Tax=Wickerhamomyces pijperi TaxID=599730 RepID=A0A9P8TRR9_WICPI|nr:hypothetical protein WICPIJ_000990 [Wickerhamomyces pijperi]